MGRKDWPDGRRDKTNNRAGRALISPNKRILKSNRRRSLRIAVYCGALLGADPAYLAAAKGLGQWIVENNHEAHLWWRGD